MSAAVRNDKESKKARRPMPFDNRFDVLPELCPALFASLPRSDQRQKGRQYIHGLLEAQGRKSIRNIATVVGGQAAEQSLHHFITSSTWEWDPVRQALAQYLARIAPPQAWVLRPMLIPKAGDHSVGVDRRFVPALGQVLNVQEATGVWAVSEELSCPINWRLHLPLNWIDDGLRRTQALIPDEIDAETPGDCAVKAVLGLPARWGLPVRPVVFDARDAEGARTLRKLRAQRVPVLARVDSSFPLVQADSTAHRRTAESGPAHRLMWAAKDLRRPVVWSPHTAAAPHTSLVAAVRVGVPGRASGTAAGASGKEMLLVGVGAPGRRWPAELWLTDLLDAQRGTLLRLGRLIDRVDRDSARIGERVGLRDFAGRSFSGWHRHITLASAAYAVSALTCGTASGQLSQVS